MNLKPIAELQRMELPMNDEELKQYKQARRSWNLVLKLVPANSSLARDAQEKLLKLPRL